jgi:hypothetical protein
MASRFLSPNGTRGVHRRPAPLSAGQYASNQPPATEKPVTGALHLDDASVDTVAQRVAELLLGKEVVAGARVDAAEIARRFRVSRDYVYRHADELGAMRLGGGPKARLRFDPATVAARLSALPSRSDEVPQRRNPRPVRRACSVDLLPIKGESP